MEYAKGQLRRYEYETGKIPHSRQKLTSPIVNAIYKKLWTKFNVTTYNNLIEDLFGDVNKEFGVYLGESGLKRAIREAQDFFKQKGRLPTQNDKIYNKWQGSIRRGHWKEFGILTWNDFLMRCFDETNRKVNRYIGKQGLINAKDDILAYEEKYNEKPVSSTPEIYGIIGAIYRGEWTEEGIDGFQDILDYVYGKFDPKKEFETWKEKAMKFYKENGYPPRKYKDEEFKGLMLDLNQGRFLPIGLSNWTSFIERALNIDFKTYKRLVLKINRKSKKRSKDWKPHGYYRGTSGFENAIQVLKSKYLENKKFPYSSAKGLSGLYNAIRKGYYTEFGVSSWNEMKEYCITRWANEKLDLSSNINEYYS